MAHHKAAIKSIRQDKKRRATNVSRLNRVRTFVKKVETAAAGNNVATAKDALKAAQKELSRAVTKGTLKAGTASRKIARLNALVKKIAASA